MPEIVIRTLERDDYEPCNDIFNQRTVAANTLQIPYTTAEERQGRFTQSDTLRRIAAEIDGRLVGTASLSIGAGRRSHVGSIGMGVHEDYQGQGVGTALMEALVDLADNWYNLRRLELEVYTDNEPAIRLYRKFGFEIEGIHRAYAFRLGLYVDACSMARLRNDAPVVQG